MKTTIAVALAATLTAGLAATFAAPAASAAAGATAYATHAAWCDAHYRSYNPATDSYTGYDGVTYACVAPTDGQLRTFASVGPLLAAPRNDIPSLNQPTNPNGPGSGTSFRLYPGDEVNGTP